MNDLRSIAVANAREQFAAPTFRDPELCPCGAWVQLNLRNGLVYDAAFTASGPHSHTCHKPAPERFPTSPGRFDQGEWKQSQRRGRERGCWVYIAAEQLAQAGIDPRAAAPEYRVWAASGRPRAVVSLRTEKP